ncbi:MAG: FAD-dependent monooxygenase [Pantoea sp.]|uniref:FAD-dependent monooxygenase n=1 Tax=Pantoea sp. TaxID=69393 RepID=UPI002382944C|nr:FAD-dependent monooxygenase [Pantoea sp.]MDE1186866.1 FAD-dependent monooxygenase [Pantoea sp.]
MSAPLRIAFVGAGLGGLAAAIAAHRAGFAVAVYDQAHAFGDIGAGIQVGPNAVKALRALGLEAGLRQFGAMPERHVGRSWRSGRVLFRSETRSACLERFGAPFFQVQRSDLHAHLRSALPAGILRPGMRCTGVETRDDTAVLRFADGSTAQADVVVGSDGIHSAVRESLLGRDDPRFTGVICWRGQVAADRLPPGLIPPDSLNWMGPGGCVVHYYVRPGSLVNWIAHRKTDAWAEESWSVEGDKQELLDAFEGWHPSLQTLFHATERCYKWALFDREPLPTWVGERIALLGDAAHPMLPFLAQGGAMAMEDGIVLVDMLKHHGGNVGSALRRYEQLRKERATRVQLGSRARAEVCQVSSPWTRFRRDLRYLYDQCFKPGAAIQRADWIYEYDVAKVAA